MLKTILSHMCEMVVFFWALAVIGYAQFGAFRLLKAGFLSMVDFARTVWLHVRILVRKVAEHVKKK